MAMTYKAYNFRQGSFTVDWATCLRIIRSHHRAFLQLKYSKDMRDSQISLNPLSWGLPDLHYVEVDWDKVNQDLPGCVHGTAHRLAQLAKYDDSGIDKFVQELKTFQYCTRANTLSFRRSLNAASMMSAREVEKSTATYQTAADRAKLVRDLSASFLVGAATVAAAAPTAAIAGVAVSGQAAAVGGAVVGGALKTTAKFQDSGSYGAAWIEAGQQLTLTVIPISYGAKAPMIYKLLINAPADACKALLEGKSMTKSVLIAASNSSIGYFAKSSEDPLKKIFGKIAVPIAVKMVEDRAKKAAQSAIKSNGSGSPKPPGPADDDSDGLQNMSFEDDMLLKFTVIDNAKGIGRSWW